MEEESGNKFDWGESVKIKDTAPSNFCPGKLASVCGMIKITPEDVRKQLSVVEPTWFYIVEFGDGSSIELPECYLDPDMENANIFTWNDLVMIKKGVPAQFHPGEVGVVCGMSKIHFEDVAKKYHSELGNWSYTVEFGDGSDIQVPEKYLEKFQYEV